MCQWSIIDDGLYFNYRSCQQMSDSTSSVNPNKKTQWVQADDTCDSERESPVLRVNGKSSHPIWVELKVND